MGEIISLNKLGSEDLLGTTGEKTLLLPDEPITKTFEPPTIPTSRTTDQGLVAPTTMLGGGTDASSRDTSPGISVDLDGHGTYQRGDATEQEQFTPGEKAKALLGSKYGKLILYAIVGIVLWKFLKS